MPMIKHILGDGPELTDSQAKVLGFLENHRCDLSRLHNDDLREIHQCINEPENDDSALAPSEARSYSLSEIRWALSTLHGRKKIGSIIIYHETYYGSFEAIEKADGETHKAEKKGLELWDRLTEAARATQGR